MFQKCLAHLLVTCTLFQIACFVVPLTWYVSNYHHIAHELCENRMHPEMECDGMCQLKERMHGDHDHSNDDRKAAPERLKRLDHFVGEIFHGKSSQDFQKSIWSSSIQHLIQQWTPEPLSPPPKNESNLI